MASSVSLRLFCGLHGLADDAADGVGGVTLHSLRGVGVGAESEARVVVAQRTGQRLDVHAVLEGQRGEGVSEVVKPDVLRADGLQDLLMGVAEGVRVEHGAGLGRYEQVGTVWVLCVLLYQQLHRPLRDGQFADGVGRLGLADHQFTVETVCLLSKLQSKEHIEIEVTMDELDLTAAESKATYEEIREYVLEHTGLKVSSLYIAQVKQKYGIIERENYNKPKSEDARQPQCPPEKEKAVTEALRHFGMI